MPSAPSWRRQPLPPGWGRIRQAVLIRDNYECQMPVPGRPRGLCLARANQVDHIIQDGGDDMANLRSLCWPHHRDRSSSQGGYAAGVLRRQIAAARYRKPEAHPGLVRP
jgi:5-methylcytosine-specific restriction endonuclease McrA